MREGPLDMRMDQNQELTAAEVVNTFGEKEIADILYNYAEERRSRAIARSIVRSRPLRLTTDLARAVERVMGGPRLRPDPSGDAHLPGPANLRQRRVGKSREVYRFLDDRGPVGRPSGRHYFPFIGRPYREKQIPSAPWFPDGC